MIVESKQVSHPGQTTQVYWFIKVKSIYQAFCIVKLLVYIVHCEQYKLITITPLKGNNYIQTTKLHQAHTQDIS